MRSVHSGHNDALPLLLRLLYTIGGNPQEAIPDCPADVFPVSVPQTESDEANHIQRLIERLGEKDFKYGESKRINLELRGQLTEKQRRIDALQTEVDELKKKADKEDSTNCSEQYFTNSRRENTLDYNEEINRLLNECEEKSEALNEQKMKIENLTRDLAECKRTETEYLTNKYIRNVTKMRMLTTLGEASVDIKEVINKLKEETTSLAAGLEHHLPTIMPGARAATPAKRLSPGNRHLSEFLSTML
jgi:chromosome segregation ATPase